MDEEVGNSGVDGLQSPKQLQCGLHEFRLFAVPFERHNQLACLGQALAQRHLDGLGLLDQDLDALVIGLGVDCGSGAAIGFGAAVSVGGGTCHGNLPFSGFGIGG